MSSVYVVCWIFLQTFQIYFCIQANSVDQCAPRGAVWSGSTLFAKMTFKSASRRQSRWQLLWLAVQGLSRKDSSTITFYTLPHDSDGVLWFHVGHPSARPCVCLVCTHKWVLRWLYLMDNLNVFKWDLFRRDIKILSCVDKNRHVGYIK